MNFNKAKVLYVKEIKDASRDRGTLLTVFILPLILYPLLFLVSGLLINMMNKSEEKLVPTIAIAKISENQSIVSLFKKSSKVQVISSLNPMEDVKEGKILAVIEAPSNIDAQLLDEKSVPVTIYYDETNRMSVKAKNIVSQLLEEYEKEIINQRLTRRNLDKSFLNVIGIEEISVSSKQKRAGFIIGVLVPYLLVILLYTASMNTATDITAGEKERKTIETLLASNIR